jgi:hypothetical protein
MKTPQEQLNEAAEKYAEQFRFIPETQSWHKQKVTDFIAGTLSSEAANGCNKHVEKAKIKFAIEQLKKVANFITLYDERDGVIDIISELQTKLNQLEQ